MGALVPWLGDGVLDLTSSQVAAVTAGTVRLRRLRINDVDGALLEARRTVEYIEKAHEGWLWPGQKKERDQRTPGERWAWIRSGLEDQASGALHRDAGTRDYKYSRAEAETLIAMATALLRLVP